MAPSVFYLLFASLFAVVCAQNLPPPIIVPKSGDVWKAGDRQTVKWSIDGVNVYDPGLNPLRGEIYIGHLTNNSRYIWFTAPLAANFTYLQQQVDIIVPTFPTAHNYFLVLVGQSDNWSQFFTIENPADPSGTGTLGTSITVTTVSQTASSIPSSTGSATSVSASVTDSATSGSASSTSSTGSTSTSASVPPSAPPSSTSASTTAASSSSTTSSGISSATVLSAPSSSSTAPASGGSNNGASASTVSIVSVGAGAIVLSFIFLVA